MEYVIQIDREDVEESGGSGGGDGVAGVISGRPRVDIAGQTTLRNLTQDFFERVRLAALEDEMLENVRNSVVVPSFSG